MKLLEDISFSGKSRLDKEAGVVHGVKILGYVSQHGYEYSKKALVNAKPLYEGIRVNVDHPDRKNLGASRSYKDRMGQLRNVTFQEDKGLVGDFHYNKKHALAEQFEYDVEHSPTNVGFSHNASGSTVRKGQKLIVESIDLLRSVDLVADAATNVGLFESKGASMRVRRKKVRRSRTATTKQLVESALDAREAKPKKALLNLIESVLDSETNPKKIREKVLTILKVSDPDGDRGDLAESRTSKGKKMKNKKELTESKLLRQIKDLKHSQRVRDLCESLGHRPTPVQLKALVLLESKKEVKQLIESFRTKGAARKGVKSSEGGEGRIKGEKIDAKNTREFLESIGLEIDDASDE